MLDKKRKRIPRMTDIQLERFRMEVIVISGQADCIRSEIDKELTKRRTGAPHLQPWPFTADEWRAKEEGDLG